MRCNLYLDSRLVPSFACYYYKCRRRRCYYYHYRSRRSLVVIIVKDCEVYLIRWKIGGLLYHWGYRLYRGWKICVTESCKWDATRIQPLRRVQKNPPPYHQLVSRIVDTRPCAISQGNKFALPVSFFEFSKWRDSGSPHPWSRVKN